MSSSSSEAESSDSGDFESDEIEMYETEATYKIDSGILVAKNSDGTYRCPFSPNRKKQSFRHQDLLAHARGIARGKKGPLKVGNHRALVKYLSAELGDRPEFKQAERVRRLQQAVPPRVAKEEKRLCPWMGIVVNIDNRETREEDGFRVAAGAADIKEKFHEFNPERVDVFHDYGGHQGTALVTFKKDIYGLIDAEAFEKSFAAVGRGRKEWETHNDVQRGLHLYGWQATEQDLRGRLGLLTEHLRKFSDLKTVADVVEDKDRINDQLVQNLVAAVGRRNDRLEACHERFVVLQNIVSEVDNLRVKAEEEKRKMEEKHKQDLEELHQKAAMDTEQHRNRMLQHQVILANKMRALEERCAEMERTETLMKQKNEAEIQQFEKAKEEAKKQLEEVSKQAELHAAMRYNQGLLQMKMIEKHEVQNKELEMQVQQQKTKLAVSQNRELEFQRVSEMLEIERGKIDGGGGQDEANNIESHEKTIKDLELKLADLQASYDLSDSMVSDLTRKERASNDEIEEARKVAVMVLKDYGAKDKLANKMMGEIDKEPWEPACRLRYRLHEEGWDIKMATQISKWEALLKDHSFRPLKMVEVTPNELKYEIKRDDAKLQALQEELGEKVCKTVMDALLELEEYNASGRYPVAVPWDFKKNQKMVMKDLILYLKDLLDGRKGKAAKRRRG
ncbi:hypothetical protein CY35_11G075900 [Sphagnum magellanicum]|nr:hypothetical protein CY35_11G075900 [Sphagnum magellanicum]